ncbi:helix-turn-helix domain-containing protein [Candidatus Woesearchaeota archaeon]|nr:helix-turn-helix domain-containing protein [Candidatus Woesearchaeota archaeon]
MEQILEDLGLNKNEARVYLALNELGTSTVHNIANKSGVHRTNVYDSLKKLINRGLVSFMVREKVNFYETTSPENLVNMLKHKETELQRILPQLKLREKMAQHEGQTFILKGTQAFISALNNLIEFGEPIFVFGASPPDNVRPHVGLFHETRIKKKIPIKVLYHFNDKERMKFAQKLSHTEVRYCDSQVNSPVTNCVCGDQVLLALWTKAPYVIQIKNKEIADAYKKYFEMLWNISKN